MLSAFQNWPCARERGLKRMTKVRAAAAAAAPYLGVGCPTSSAPCLMGLFTSRVPCLTGFLMSRGGAQSQGPSPPNQAWARWGALAQFWEGVLGHAWMIGNGRLCSALKAHSKSTCIGWGSPRLHECIHSAQSELSVVTHEGGGFLLLRMRGLFTQKSLAKMGAACSIFFTQLWESWLNTLTKLGIAPALMTVFTTWFESTAKLCSDSKNKKCCTRERKGF